MVFRSLYVTKGVLSPGIYPKYCSPEDVYLVARCHAAPDFDVFFNFFFYFMHVRLDFMHARLDFMHVRLDFYVCAVKYFNAVRFVMFISCKIIVSRTVEVMYEVQNTFCSIE